MGRVRARGAAVGALGLALILGALVAGPAIAEEPGPVEVLQPQDADGNVLWLSAVTYFGYFDWRHPGRAVAFTCSSNVVPRHDGPPANMNAAARYGFRVEVLTKDPARAEYLFGDTLKVVLDVSSLDTVKTIWSREALVGATLECILVNGSKWSTDVRNVAVAIRGPTDVQKFAGVYGAWRFRCGPRRTQFY